MIEWLFLLLPVAAASGWWVGKRAGEPAAVPGQAPDPAYFRGLNYLLNEQPDKAIDVFLKLAEVDGETVETHLALGSLFRRRGEVDRAIRIHQSLVARTNLEKQQRAHALYELGQDYLSAGLFDRAESLLRELIDMRLHRRLALEGLREIYQQEKDWRNCLEVAEKLQSLTGASTSVEIAHYHCELAEVALKEGDRDEADTHLRNALAADAQCVRATMFQARIAMNRGDAARAIDLYRRVADQGPRFLPEILPGLLAAQGQSGGSQPLDELRSLFEAHPYPPLMLYLADAVARARGSEAAVSILVDYVSGYADLAGLERLLQLQEEQNAASWDPAQAAAHRAVLRVVRHLRDRQPEYKCDHCGFVARRLHWQCPSCMQWGKIQPVQPPPISPGGDSAPHRGAA